MANNNTTHILRGTLHWAKVLGEPRMNTFTNEREWSVDLTPDKNARAELKRLGLSDRLRTPKSNDDRKETFLSLRVKEFRKDGVTKNEPIRIVDAGGRPWGDGLIGNGSVGDVKVQVRDYGPGKKKGLYIRAIRILDHVEYEVQEFAPLSEDDEFFAADDDNLEVAEAEYEFEDADEGDDLDDEMPE